MKKLSKKRFVFGFIFLGAFIGALFLGSQIFLWTQGTTIVANQQRTATSDSTTTSTSETPSASDLPAVSPTDWDLVLVGPNNQIIEEVAADQLTAISGSEEVDSRIVDAYNQLASAAEAAGYPLVVVSAFRSVADQQQVYDASVNRRMSEENISYEQAVEETNVQVTQPGYSEHHTGLAIDVVDSDWYNNYSNYASDMLDPLFGEQPAAQWLAANCAQYGFIIRYPEGREDITGITYEPWHLRYVGVDSAEYITSHNLTLEEYLALFN
ncbi:M15 family metallopeptidase [Enterococcus sp. HY326]|uniref:M15 family metallopeptidase n=1 Tax=Enterococcus sp. HY326 TaxID=2971265 RepID=UPI00223FA0CC|nr:M15 family metallopeptidase [Enterococcus sp. HY326]